MCVANVGKGGRPSSGRPETNFLGVSEVRIEVRHPPPSSTGIRIAIYFAFRTFLHAIQSGRPRHVGGGGFLPNGQCRTGGGPKKSVFARTSTICPSN